MADHQSDEVILNGIISRLKQEIMLCLADDIVAGMEVRAEKDLDKMLELTKEFISGVDDFITEHEGTVPDVREKWANIKAITLAEVLAHKKAISIKIASLKPTNTMDDYHQKILDLKLKKFEMEQNKLEADKKRTEEEAKRFKCEATAQTKAKLAAFREE